MDALLTKYQKELEPLSQQRFQELATSESSVLFNQNQCKNRYSNIIPYSHSQPPGEYFHGNFVSIGGIQFFITQAPVDAGDFYAKMAQVQSTSVIQVTKFAEGGILKAERYVPLATDEDVAITQNAILADRLSLAIKAQQQGQPMKTVEDCLRAAPQRFAWFQDSFTTPSGTVSVKKYEQINSFYRYQLGLGNQTLDYYYFPNWSDQSAPDNMKEISSLCHHLHGQTNLTVHCSAGIGRSTTFCICFYIFEQFINKTTNKSTDSWNKLPINIFDIIENFRKNRHPFCVQTIEQFKFILEFCEFCDQK
ncbi:Protein tyrosine phosphatase [Spironucleus salmonicida]|uniref:Protein tyrosine phosphatase n=1 Tax=Spironucleus salmonicida TaxID=348837 RepID=V6LDE5_9EUKA|nr:Protein tyrosine phosphatase [Spironucleus salmonicida]|eukprot:EST41681.1 Protein tyrosine phosphatase [Spironucleus salmonicida]